MARFPQKDQQRIDQEQQAKSKPSESSTRTIVQQAQWAGPIPPPAALEHFEQVLPGGADRIVRMAEQEQSHRIECEKVQMTAMIADTRRGQFLGAVVAILALLGAVLNSYLGGPWQVSMALVGVPIAGVVRALIDGRK